MRTTKKVRALFLALLSSSSLSLFSATDAEAFVISECDGRAVRWRGIDFDSEAVRLRMANVSFPEVSGWTTMLTDSVSKWNRQPTRGRFLLSRENNVALENDQNETWLTDSNDILDGAPAITALSFDWWDCEKIIETDVVFRSNGNLTPSRASNDLSAYGGRSRLFESVALHELGHALGLNHNGMVLNIMGSDVRHLQTNGNRSHGHIGQDAAAGTEYLYGISNNHLPDFSVHHVKFTGAPGAEEYAPNIGTRTTSVEAFGSNLQIGQERVITVRQGQPLDIEFTPDHNNVGNYRTQIGIYLSGDREITPNDRRILLQDYAVLKEFPPSVEHFNLRIPNTLPAGEYYVGAIIDPDNRVEEMYEDNNATFAMYADKAILKVRVEAIEAPTRLDQRGAGLGGGIDSFYSPEGALQLDHFPELMAVQEGFGSFPNLACKSRFRLLRNGILEATSLTPLALPGTAISWVPTNGRGTLSSGNYTWSVETLCDGDRIVSAARQLPLNGGRHFYIRVPGEFPSAFGAVQPTRPTRLVSVAYPQPTGLPVMYMAGESFDGNGDELTFRFTYRLVPGSSTSRDAARVRALQLGTRVEVGPLAHPPLGSATLATSAYITVQPAGLVDGRYTWELCSKDRAQIWQCSNGPEVRLIRR